MKVEQTPGSVIFDGVMATWLVLGHFLTGEPNLLLAFPLGWVGGVLILRPILRKFFPLT
jgi:hypothetical protein